MGTEAYDSDNFLCSGEVCTNADAALLVYTNSDSAAFGYIPKPTADSSTIVDIANQLAIVDEAADVFEGDYVEKFGIISGYSHGQADRVCTAVKPTNTLGRTEFLTLCSVQASYVSNPGDSGGIVFYSDWPSNHSTTQAIVYGVHFAGDVGSGWFSPWSQIETVYGDLSAH